MIAVLQKLHFPCVLIAFPASFGFVRYSWLLKPKLLTPTLSADSKSLKFPSKNQAKIRPKSVTCSQIFQNWRSHCIEAIFCLSLLGAFQKSADKVHVCKSGLNQFKTIKVMRIFTVESIFEPASMWKEYLLHFLNLHESHSDLKLSLRFHVKRNYQTLAVV